MLDGSYGDVRGYLIAVRRQEAYGGLLFVGVMEMVRYALSNLAFCRIQ